MSAVVVVVVMVISSCRNSDKVSPLIKKEKQLAQKRPKPAP